ncbi:MAG: amidohydrolase family protein [bacterium]
MIDFHTYPVLVREMVEGSDEMLRATRDVFQCGNNLQPLEVFHLQMDAGGVDTAVILPIACKRARGVDVFTNAQIAELVKRSGRFVGFASVDPEVKGAAQQLEKDVKAYGLKGVHLLPGMQDFDPYSKGATEVYEAARSLQIPILFETGMSWAPDTPLEPGRPIHFERIIRSFRDVPIVLSHLGWPWVAEAVALGLKYDNVYLDTSALYHDHPIEFGRFVFNHLIPKTVIERSLRERVLMGSCYPRMEIKHAIEMLEGAGLNADAIEAISGENARRLLKL